MTGNGWEEMALEIHEWAKLKGFWDVEEVDFPFIAYKIAMIHSEVTEVMEAIRKDKGSDEVLEELADTMIRIFDLYAALKEAGEITDGFLKQAVLDKMAKNRARPHKHGVRG